SSTVHDSRCLQRFPRAGVPISILEFCAAVPVIALENATHMQLQSPASAQFADQPANLRGNAVTVNFPKRSQVPKKAMAIGQAHASPDPLRFGSKAIDHCPPTDAFLCCDANLTADFGYQRYKRWRQLSNPFCWPSAAILMRCGQQPTARQNTDAPLETAR